MSDRFERIRRPDPAEPSRGDSQGKRAIYSVDPESNPTPAVLVECRRCGVERGLTAREATSLLRPPFLANPLTHELWARCPTCERRAWLKLRRGPGIPWPFPG